MPLVIFPNESPICSLRGPIEIVYDGKQIPCFTKAPVKIVFMRNILDRLVVEIVVNDELLLLLRLLPRLRRLFLYMKFQDCRV